MVEPGGTMEVSRALRIESLRQRIDRSEYRVDIDKVAEAILGRPTAHVWLLPASIRAFERDNGDRVASRTPAA
jgi:hypothetical protein